MYNFPSCHILQTHVYHLCSFFFSLNLESLPCYRLRGCLNCFFLFGSWVMRSDQWDLTPSRAQSSQSERWLGGSSTKRSSAHHPPRSCLRRRPLEMAKWARAWSSTRPVRLITFVSEEAGVGSTQQGLFSRREERMVGRDFNPQQNNISWRCCKCRPGVMKKMKKMEKESVVWRTVIVVGDVWWHFLNLAKNRQREPFEFRRQTSTFFFVW